MAKKNITDIKSAPGKVSGGTIAGKKMQGTEIGFAFSKENYLLLIIGFAIIIVGFLLMIGGGVDDPNVFYPNGDPSKTPDIFSFRRITLAPIVILAGFIFEIYAIMKKPKEEAGS